MKEDEIWKVYIVITFRAGCKRIYEVSNYGNVKLNGVLVIPWMKNGYKLVGSFYVHRAVAELFIPNPDNKPCVDHIDTDRTNNYVGNLRWVTHEENMNNQLTKLTHCKPHKDHKPYKQHKQHKQITDSSKMGKGTLGKHRIYDDREHNIYHYE